MNLKDGLVLLLFTIFLSCATSKKETSPPKIDSSTKSQSYKALAAKKFKGDDVDYLYSADSSAVLCVRRVKSTTKSLPTLRFFVYQMQNNEVIYEESLANGKVKWIDKSRFQVTTVPGIVSYDDEENHSAHGYVYDVKLRRKVGPAPVDQ